MRLVSYNVHRCIGARGGASVERVAEVLRELAPDVVALQEVLSSERIPKTGQLEQLADAVGLVPVPGATLVHADGPYGNGLLLSGPPVEVIRHDLSVAGREPRGALEVTVEGEFGRVRLINTHLGLSARERRGQVRRLEQIVTAPGEPLVALLGDTNEWRPRIGDPLRALDRRLERAPSGRTFPSRRPLVALDRIWIGPGFSLRDSGSHRSPLARMASDHLPVFADVEHGGSAEAR